jgi:hypothetical protein
MYTESRLAILQWLTNERYLPSLFAKMFNLSYCSLLTFHCSGIGYHSYLGRLIVGLVLVQQSPWIEVIMGGFWTLRNSRRDT